MMVWCSINVRIPNSGSRARDGGIPEIVVCGILVHVVLWATRISPVAALCFDKVLQLSCSIVSRGFGAGPATVWHHVFFRFRWHVYAVSTQSWMQLLHVRILGAQRQD